MTTRPSLLVEVEFTAGVWTDLTESIDLARTEIVTTRGRASQSDDGQPGTFSCVFENLDGALTPDNPAGTYYPNVVPGKRLRYTVGAGPDRTNLIANPSFETNATGWSVLSGCTVARSTGQAYSGTASLALTATSTGTGTAISASGTSGIAVVAGETYAASAYFYTASSSRIGYVNIGWFNAAGSYLSTSGDGSNVLTSSAWTRDTCVAVAPAGAAFAAVTLSVGTMSAAEVAYADAVTFEQASTVGTYFDGSTSGYEWTGTAHASTSRTYTNTRFLGRIVSWDPSFAGDGQSDSIVNVTAVDLLGDLATSRMRSGLWYEQRADSPLRQYALDDPSSNLGAADSTGAGGVLTRRQSGTGGSCDFAASSQGVDDGAVVSFAQGDTTSDFVYLSTSQRSSTIIASVSLRMKPAADGAKRGAVRFYYEGPGFTTPSSTFIKQLTIGVNEAGRLFVDYVDSESTVTTNATGTSVLPQDLWTQVVVTLSGASYYCYVNGTLEVTGSRGISPSMPLGLLQVSTPYTAFGTSMGPWVGSVGDVAVYTSVLSGGRIAAHALAGSSASTETVGARVTRVCGYLGIAASGSGGKMLGSQPFGGRFALDVLQEAVRGDSRVLHADTYNTVTYRPDARPWAASVTLDAEGDLDGTPTWSRSGQGRYAIQRANSPTGGLALALDSGAPVSGSEGSTIETALAYADDVRQVAERAVAEARDDRLRISRVVVDVVTAQNITPSDLLSRVPGDRVRVSGLPGSVLGWTYQDGHLLGMTERASISAYVVEMDLGAADAPPEARFDSDSGRWGVDGTATVGALTSSGTTVVITSSGTPFTMAAGSYPLDVDINGERVTLTSAPGTSTSPQTFTGVTRGVAPSVARAHSAGEAVDVWRSARFTT